MMYVLYFFLAALISLSLCAVSIFRLLMRDVLSRDASIPPSRRMSWRQRAAYVFREDWRYTKWLRGPYFIIHGD